jgi:hypothetical protein
MQQRRFRNYTGYKPQTEKMKRNSQVYELVWVCNVLRYTT